MTQKICEICHKPILKNEPIKSRPKWAGRTRRWHVPTYEESKRNRYQPREYFHKACYENHFYIDCSDGDEVIGKDLGKLHE